MFTKALAVIKSVLGSSSVIAPILAAFGVAIPPAAVAAVPAAITLMTAAEEAFGDGTGPIKKAAVTEGLVAIAGGMQKVSTGGQAETWAKVTPDVISTTVDTIAAVANDIARQMDADDVFDASTFVYTAA
jgi:hypothetical protein